MNPNAPLPPRIAPASRPERAVLVAALIVLAVTYAIWFRNDAYPLLALLVFALPPLLLAIGVAAGRRTAGFWAGVLALLWFSHGVMLAWSEPVGRGYALAVTALSVVVVFASSMRGLMARFSRRPGTDPGTGGPGGPDA